MFKIYNTLSRQLEELVPLKDNHVRLYTCGPTVYNYAHIGNYRAYMFEDLLRRWIQYKGMGITQVQNLTDVDDKTIRGSRETGKPLREYTQTYKDAFFEDLKTLNIQPAEHYPAATDCIPEMIELIEKLFEKGLAYKSDDGSVYFPIDKFPEYGKLARLDREGMRSGARVDQDEYDKDNAADFALWKGYVEEDGDVVWDSPWGKGRPGWHIECSAMSQKYLGKTFDLHCGGVDNIFPHHEDEIAQSEGANGCLYSKYWMHNAHLQVEGKKMSKSEGNFFTLREILDKGYSGREIRYELIGTHYRQSLNFTFASLNANRAALARLDEFYAKLQESIGGETEAGELPEWAATLAEKFEAALDDDLNIAGALGALFDGVHEGNKSFPMSGKEALAVSNLWKKIDSVLGFLEPPKEDVPAELIEMANARVEAKKNKDWAEADRLRDAIAAAGWIVQDTPTGPKLKKQ
ncbi:cysteine--tRNA ligase [Tichowtungia aerotolerans]|uniref:Cysteine--tRNA ligase n=1 Tax=Tichowtungia aerotolerans TaxID=2697043 RepID=A0A6P1M282_9BACT|nr:cysteine--tRNA ligase [Tichowtungia aerotolerans]QHI67937.1 cysteine--tRNA ligase [Tichowtungia aerotolerans]